MSAKFKVTIKHLLKEDAAPKDIINACDALINELNGIMEALPESDIIEEEADYLHHMLFDFTGNFEYAADAAAAGTPDYTLFKEYLEELYDLAGKDVTTATGKMKFITIE